MVYDKVSQSDNKYTGTNDSDGVSSVTSIFSEKLLLKGISESLGIVLIIKVINSGLTLSKMIWFFSNLYL